mgnify:FL=1|jgi:hypothetical protein|tara:strand:+ start:2196 stop:3248 length:1053 start_codon:yes stop_codon:yes gene_type:complete
MKTLHVYSNRHIKDKVKTIKNGDWIYLENSFSKKRWSLYFRANNINEKELNITYITYEEYMELALENDMKFDAIVGNPPYQDNSNGDNQQNKIYNQFSKKALELLNPTGILCFTTPVAVASLSKRFSLTEVKGIKEIDFSANNDFNVGAKICSWVVDKTYHGDIKITDLNGNVSSGKPGTSVFDPAVVDVKFALLVEKLLKLPIQDRAFKQNIYATTSSTKSATEKNKHPLHKLDSNGNLFAAVYVSKIPFFNEKTKLSISRSKSFRDEIILIGTENLDTQYVNIDIDINEQVDNIKSFLFSEYFRNHMTSWKKLYNTGFNDALKYVPPFDKNKKWTSVEVKELFENYAR